MDESSPARSAKLPARLLALLALVVAFAIVVFVITQSLSDESGDGSSADRGNRSGQVNVVGRGGHGKPAGQGQAAFYVVKPGDTLTTIAEKTGLSVDELQRLNPRIDPRTLISGQRIKLR